MTPSRFDLKPIILLAGVFFAVWAITFSSWAQRMATPELPEAVTSFGAATLDGHLYVYSGHTGKAHDFSRENYSKNFRRWNLRQGGWEDLEMEEPAQGFALVAWEGKLYRVGGSFARNASGEKPVDMWSTNSFSQYDPKTGKWTRLAPLPEPRSSLDAAVHEGKLYVIGGWKLEGDAEEGDWSSDFYVADLTKESIEWESLPRAPFQHRAMAVAATNRFVYSVGGMDSDGSVSDRVFIYDPKSKQWFEGPRFPAQGKILGFGASAFGVGRTIWASGRSGRVYALDDGAKEWRDTGHDLKIPRFFHRMVPDGNGNLYFIGGAASEGYTKSIESVDLTLLEARPAATKATAGASPSSDPVSPGQTNWTGFRGSGQSHSQARQLPLEWSDEKNVAWSIDLKGAGQSSPVVWRDRVFVTSVEGPEKETLRVSCFRLDTGEALWERPFGASQKVALSDYVSKAAPTPAVDEDRLYAFFESGDLIALDHDGKELWKRSLTTDYGPFMGNHGVGSSVALSSAGLVVLIDHDGPSYLLCLNPATGENVWKVDRQKRVSWSSPIVMKSGDGEEILISSNGVAESYDAATGAQNWMFDGIEGNTVASPSFADDLVIIGSSSKGESRAIRAGGKGILDKNSVAWTPQDASSNFCSPLVHDGCVYFVNRAGVVFCNDLATGKLNWSLRLRASCWASAIAAGDRLYFFSTNGDTTILQSNPKEPVQLGLSSLSTTSRVYGVAAVDGNLLFRMESRLVCVREP